MQKVHVSILKVPQQPGEGDCRDVDSPLSFMSCFSPCFSRRVGAMVIGTIEIDGAQYPMWGGGLAVPMETHHQWGEPGTQQCSSYSAGQAEGPTPDLSPL